MALNPYGGNVGIGTTAPGQKLDIAGNIALSASGGGYIYGDTTTPNLRLSNSGGAVLSYGTISNISMGNPTIVLTAASAPRISLGAGLAFGSTYYSLTSPGTNNMIIEGGLGVGYSTLGTATLAINGNVGIGTTAPGNRLTLSTSGVDDTIPALGVNGGKLGIFRDLSYGMIMGQIVSGDGFVQVQNVVGSSVAYNLGSCPVKLRFPD